MNALTNQGRPIAAEVYAINSGLIDGPAGLIDEPSGFENDRTYFGPAKTYDALAAYDAVVAERKAAAAALQARWSLVGASAE